VTSVLTWRSIPGWLWILSAPAAVVAALAVASILASIGGFVYSFLVAPRFLFPRKPQTERYAHRRIPPRALNAMVREVWSLMLFVGLYMCRPMARGFNMSPGQGVPPVIFVHGYGVSTMSWYWFMRMLARRGVGRPMYALEYNWLAPVEESSQDLARLIERALAEQGASQVDIIAHSWGGFLSRWYIERLGQGARVRQLIMISTPLQGTWMALLAFGGPRREMEVGSRFVMSLAAAPPSPPYATLWSECDQIVTPPQLCLLADPDGNLAFSYRFTGIAHLTMQRDAHVADVVAALCENPSAWTSGRD
jgi:triacylglycerol lipase